MEEIILSKKVTYTNSFVLREIPLMNIAKTETTLPAIMQYAEQLVEEATPKLLIQLRDSIIKAIGPSLFNSKGKIQE